MPYHRAVTRNIETGETEEWHVRIDQQGFLDWVRDRASLREEGKPDRPPDVDTPTMRVWLPHPGEHDMAFFASQQAMTQRRMGTTEFFAVETYQWHGGNEADPNADSAIALYAFMKGGYYLRIWDERVEEVHRFGAEATDDEVDDLVKQRAIAIDGRGWQARYPYYSTYLDIMAVDAEMDLAEADIARGFLNPLPEGRA